MRSFTLYFLPAVGLAANIFGLFYAWVGIKALVRGEFGVGVFLIVFGFGGIALGTAMITTWRKLVKQARQPGGSSAHE